MAAASALALAALGTVLAFICDAYMPKNVNIRIDLVLNPLLMLVAWLHAIGLTIWAAVAR